MVNQKKVTNLETGRSPWAISSAQFTFMNVPQVSSCLLSHRLLVSLRIPNRALKVLRKGGAEEPSRSSSMKKLVGGETCRGPPLRVHG